MGWRFEGPMWAGACEVVWHEIVDEILQVLVRCYGMSYYTEVLWHELLHKQQHKIRYVTLCHAMSRYVTRPPHRHQCVWSARYRM